MANIIWSIPAYDDLDEITDYIAIDKVSAAIKLMDRAIEKVGRLSEYPESGRRLPEFKDSKYRELIINPCRVLYNFEKNTVYIVRIIRSERNLRKYMLEDVIHEKGSGYNSD